MTTLPNTISLIKLVLEYDSSVFVRLWKHRVVSRSWKDAVENYSPRLVARLITDKCISRAVQHDLLSILDNYFYLVREKVSMPFVTDPNDGLFKAVVYKRLEMITAFLAHGFDPSAENRVGYSASGFFLSKLRETLEDRNVASVLFPDGIARVNLVSHGIHSCSTIRGITQHTKTTIGLEMKGSKKVYIFNSIRIVRIVLNGELYDNKGLAPFGATILDGVCAIVITLNHNVQQMELQELVVELSV